MGFLTDHNAFRRQESAQRRLEQPEATLRERIAQRGPCRDFAGALLAVPAPGIIAEVKFRSPSKGSLRPAKDVEVVAQSYQQAGASCLSVLVDGRHFDGDWAFLDRARGACELPLLAKGFFCDPYDLLEARASGADAALLIARSLSRAELETMLGTARELGLQTLLELHGEDDLEKAEGLELDLVGVNHRDLDTLVMDMDLSRRLADHMPPARVRVSESGLNTPEDLERMVGLGYQAVLMGTRFMSQPQPGLELAQLLKELRAAR
ncbi:indole-3-glycerol phosphate synthase TrpC [Holophaga foetida]|uniref:indole-3-glycerol phosphate synthase TrpC n=1 Tax=Holophaga foetida TaxID=35839 RepID=UPI0002474623|nr:indole-3-glycerol phosphate synthase TrpC [Holophaga foetida]